MSSLLSVLLAHFLVDIVKTERMRVEKARLNWSAYVRHGLLMWGGLWFALAWPLGNSWRAFICALSIAVAHVCVDFVKYLAIRKHERLRRGLVWLFFDFHELLLEFLIRLTAVGLHVIALDLLVGLFFPPRYELATTLWYVRAHLLGKVPIPTGDQLLYLALLFVLGTIGGALVIQFVERAFFPGDMPDITEKKVWEMRTNPLQEPVGETASYTHSRMEESYSSSPEKPGVSFWVGILERCAIMLCPLMPQLGLTIAAVLSIKSLARYNQFKHAAFAKYFIVGTISSMIWGIFFAWLEYRALHPAG